MLDDFGDVGDMTRADFTEDTLIDEDDATRKPVAPKDTDGVERALVTRVRLDHAEHAVQLPADEEDDEQVMCVPELLEVARGTATLLPGKPNHNSEASGHDPTGDAGSRHKVSFEEDDAGARAAGGSSDRETQPGKVDHVGEGMDGGKEHNRPRSGNMEADVVVEWDDIVQRRLAEQGDEVAANGEENKDDVDVEDEGGSTRNNESDSERCPRTSTGVLEVVVQETERSHKKVEEDKSAKEQMRTSSIDKPHIETVHESDVALGGIFLALG